MGRQPFPIREIAIQAGVSDATVDRVLHGREGVRAATAARVKRAIAELQRQQTEFELGGRTFTVDLVMHTPKRFSNAVRAAFDAAVPAMRPAAFRVRPHVYERIAPAWLVHTLDTIAARGSHAVVLKAPDVPAVNAAVERLAELGIPVITIVTDLPTSRRVAYVGIDNRASGATAAYLTDQWLGHGRRATVLLTISSLRFRGEEEREAGFRSVARTIAPQWRIIDLAENEGVDASVAAQLDLVARHETIDAVYSIGGGNRAVLRTLERHGREPSVYVAHDLDADNVHLLATGRVSAVLHHDLRSDARRACQLIMQAHGALPGRPASEPAPVQVITPSNVPTTTSA
jgi:LacI family transcriptional regulator